MLLVTDLERGGTPLRLARIARGLRAAGVDVHVGCLAGPGPVSHDLDAAGFATFSCDARSPRDLGAIARLAKHVRRIRPDLMHATLTHANIAARLVGWTTRTPVLTSTATIEIERRWHVWAERLTGWLDRGHVAHGRALEEHVKRNLWLPAAHVHVLPPSMERVPARIDREAARAQLGVDDSEFAVLWIGRFDPVKRLDVVVRCAEIMNVVPVRFLLAGDGPFRPAVEKMIRLSSTARIVSLLGWQDDLGPALSAADALLFPSRTEGLPNAVLEAMAFGVPIVASDIPSLRELSGDGARMLLVEGAEPKPYADALMMLRGNPAVGTALVERAADWARANLDPNATIRGLLAIYQRVARRSALCRPG